MSDAGVDDILADIYPGFQSNLPVTKYLVNLIGDETELGLKETWNSALSKLQNLYLYYDYDQELGAQYDADMEDFCSVVAQEINLLSNHRKLAFKELVFVEDFLPSLALLRDAITPLLLI